MFNVSPYCLYGLVSDSVNVAFPCQTQLFYENFCIYKLCPRVGDLEARCFALSYTEVDLF